MQAPYTGPPSYQTIARRLSSSEIDLQSYFIRKHQKNAKDRGEFVDIFEGWYKPGELRCLDCGYFARNTGDYN